MAKQRRTIRHGSRVAILTCDGKYVTADLNRDHQLFGMAQDIKAWEIFEIVDASKPFFENSTRQVCYGDKIGLKALNNIRFVGADLNNEKQLTTWSSQLRGWETFTLCLTPECLPKLLHASGFSLRANKKTTERSSHADRDTQFGHIKRMCQ